MRASSCGLALFLLAPALFAHGPPHVDPAAEDRATARALMDDGDALLAKNDLRGALAKYTAADDIMGVPTTGIAVAQTQAKLLLLVEAANTAARVQRYPVEDGEPAAFTSARDQAGALLEEVNARLPTATIRLAGEPPADVTVTFDGRELHASVRFMPRKIDPGKHQVVIEAPGLRGSAAFDIAERETRTVDVTLAPAAVSPPPPPGRPQKPIFSMPAAPQPINPGVWIGLGVAGAGLVAGAVTGALTLARNSTLKDPANCGPEKQCVSADAQAALDQSYRLANASTACFVVAGAGGVVALTAWLVTRTPKTPSRGAIAPLIGPGFAGAMGSF